MDVSSPLKYSYCIDCSGNNGYFSGVPTSDRDCVQKCDSTYFMNYKFSDDSVSAYKYCVNDCKYAKGLALVSAYQSS